MVTKRISTSIHFLNRGLLHKKVKEVDSCQINERSNQHWHGPYDKNSQFKKGMWTFWTSTCNAGPPRSWFPGPECRWETPPTCRSRPGRSRHWGCWWPCRTSSRCCNQYHRWPPSSSWCLEISRHLRFFYLIHFFIPKMTRPIPRTVVTQTGMGLSSSSKLFGVIVRAFQCKQYKLKTTKMSFTQNAIVCPCQARLT